ncbi:protein PIGMENT DEFECTIVE 338, chloroplastic-like [Lotus japonicus]|uniref:protein PIGMENT DEFECTIVE 338, chloroplastic-like n=1 Tax=Lotus japonicus TaxID=34305 RepID=UPI00258E4328|nr:protein PIGMENT DEFECTIVE 338, chloroplastic-like [Lotus japonicus]
MPFILHPCKFLCFQCRMPVKDTSFFSNTFIKKSHTKSPSPAPQKLRSFAVLFNPHSSKKVSILSDTHFTFCSRNGGFDGISSDLSPEANDDGTQELELLNKPYPVRVAEELASEAEMDQEKPSQQEALAPFLKFFKGSDSMEEVEEDGDVLQVSEEKYVVDGENEEEGEEEEEDKKVGVEYYEPKPGDFVVGVVVSGNEYKLDINVGADLLGTMLTKEVLPLYGKEMENLLFDVEKDTENFMAQGKIGIVKNDEALSGVPVPGRPVVETGTILFAEVLGRTLSGRPLLSTRRFFRRIAWHRVRQIQQLNEPIEVRITEWNTGGLLTRIEGLRAFLAKAELVKRVNTFTELKENVGRRMYVQITRIDEDKNSLMLSEKKAWEKLFLREGTLLDGTVKKIFPYGAQIKIGVSNRSGLLHISNISRAEITSVSDVLSVDENVKVLVVKSAFPDKISLSIAALESEPGLFLSNKERVFLEAEMMAKKYKQKLPPAITTKRLDPLPTSALPFENEALYANWKWFKFEK